MTQMKVATHVLNERRVGHFVDLVTLGSRETLKEFKVDTTQWSFIIEGSTGTFQIVVSPEIASTFQSPSHARQIA